MRQTDFENLRALVVGGKPHAVQTLRTVLGLLGVKKIVTEEAPRALERLCAEPFDAVFCDEHVSPIDGRRFAFALRRHEGVLNPLVPVFLVCGSPIRGAIEAARDDGITDVIVRPMSASTVREKLRVAILTPKPFIAAEEFFGPDRRRRNRENWRAEERRTRAPRKVILPAALGETPSAPGSNTVAEV